MTYQTITAPIGAEGRYWDALIEGHLELPRCKGCGKWHWPAVWRCGECGSWDHEWRRQDLQGTVFSHVRTHHPFAGTEAFSTPFVTVVVELDAVPIRLLGILEGDNAGLKIGSSVTGAIARTEFRDSFIPAIRWRMV